MKLVRNTNLVFQLEQELASLRAAADLSRPTPPAHPCDDSLSRFDAPRAHTAPRRSDDDPPGAVATRAEQKRLERFLAALVEQGRADRTVRAYHGDWRHLAHWYRRTFDRPFDLGRLRELDRVDYAHHLRRAHAPATATRRLVFLRLYAAASRLETAP